MFGYNDSIPSKTRRRMKMTAMSMKPNKFSTGLKVLKLTEEYVFSATTWSGDLLDVTTSMLDI